MEQFKSLIDALVDGDNQQALEKTEELLALGISHEQIVVDGIHKAMQMLDSKCTAEQFNLLELMLTGRAVSTVINRLFKNNAAAMVTKERIVLVALEGDIHDLGKSIVKTVLLGKGYDVIDCGKDVSIETLVERVKSEKARAVCISGLISSVVPKVRQVKPALAEADCTDVTVLAGGAALKQASAEALNVDYVGKTAFDAGIYLDKLLGYNHDES
jgi:methylmalonyl-CoA mutase cobalamin-binding domain/chain